MFRNILLPVDLSDRHQAALNVAADLAGPSDGEVTLLHVIEVIPGLPIEEDLTFYHRLEKVARKHLNQLGGILRHRKVNRHAEILYGPRGPKIVQYAQEKDVDLIVLTSPRFDPDHVGVSWGSLSYKVSVLAPCPVLLVKSEPGDE
jgi:nucleotide-binding universal stress UspA family protein